MLSRNHVLIEKLESRQFLSVTIPTISESGGVLRAAGTDFNDTITVGLTSDHLHVNVHITNAQTNNLNDSTTLLAGLTRIRIHGLGGDDNISIDNTNGPLTGVQLVIFGDAGNDIISGDNGANQIFGGPGNDIITGGSGNNLILGGGGNDTISTGSGKNLIFAGFGNDTVTAGDGNNTVEAGAGNDTVTTGNGNNVIFGRGGNDTITAGIGANWIFGGFGTDTVNATTSTISHVFANAGDDTVNVALGSVVWGGSGTDSLIPAPSATNHIHEGDPPAMAAIETLFTTVYGQ